MGMEPSNLSLYMAPTVPSIQTQLPMGICVKLNKYQLKFQAIINEESVVSKKYITCSKTKHDCMGLKLN